MINYKISYCLVVFRQLVASNGTSHQRFTINLCPEEHSSLIRLSPTDCAKNRDPNQITPFGSLCCSGPLRFRTRLPGSALGCTDRRLWVVSSENGKLCSQSSSFIECYGNDYKFSTIINLYVSLCTLISYN